MKQKKLNGIVLKNGWNCVRFFLSFVGFSAEEIMPVIDFETIIGEVIRTNENVFQFWQEVLVVLVSAQFN